MGSFELGTAGIEHVNGDVMKVYGKVAGVKLQFLLDSGASCNFIGLTLFRTLGLKLETCERRSVRLADGKMLTTCGEARV